MQRKRLLIGTKRLSTSAVLRAALTRAIAFLPGVGLGLSAAAQGAMPPTGTGVMVSAAASPYGRILVVGSGEYQGMSLYFLTSDQPPTFSCTPLPPGVSFGCTNAWPPLLTSGQPVAGPGIDPRLLGTVTRPDLGDAMQVTYAGHPLYRYFQDTAPGQVKGEDLNEPSSPPSHGIWYLVSPRSLPNPGVATLTPMSVSGGGVILGAALNSGIGTQLFAVYSFSADSAHRSACTGQCAVAWPPLLTNRRPQATNGVNQEELGTIVRPDGTRQVTYNGHPLYLFWHETGPGTDSGNGITHFDGTFSMLMP